MECNKYFQGNIYMQHSQDVWGSIGNSHIKGLNNQVGMLLKWQWTKDEHRVVYTMLRKDVSESVE
ncbi:hypothetical protein TRIUR3_32995 [Triticum urartu]|uniref:Uncharacterized protein n=1 Tax=Triticum urartu TaxID=4572 RepID=M7ZGV2_TRIUA|nr:hypothetical protein TRIUR3_32995 [Triticum urartu]